MSKIETTSKLSLKLPSRINLAGRALSFGDTPQAPPPLPPPQPRKGQRRRLRWIKISILANSFKKFRKKFSTALHTLAREAPRHGKTEKCASWKNCVKQNLGKSRIEGIFRRYIFLKITPNFWFTILSPHIAMSR